MDVDTNFSLISFKQSGLYGKVWLASQTIPDRRVAVKFLNPEYGMHSTIEEHARGLVKAGPHPNIVTVYQVTKLYDPDRNEVVDAIIMEWLDGTTLGDRLLEADRHPISIDEARRICEGVVAGVSHLHSKNVTHSDLHPGNVILAETRPCIIDVDYSEARSLSRITTSARDHRIIGDVSQLAYLIGLIILRSQIPPMLPGDHIDKIRRAESVAKVSGLLLEFFTVAERAIQHNSVEVTPPLSMDDPTNLQVVRDRSKRRAIRSPTKDNCCSLIEDSIDRRQRAKLRRLVMEPVNKLAASLASEKYQPIGPGHIESFRERLANYRSELRSYLPIFATLGYWGCQYVNKLTVEAIDRLANAHENVPLQSGVGGYIRLQKFPVIASVYSAGIGAIANENFTGLFRILRDTVAYDYSNTRRTLWRDLAFWPAENREVLNKLSGLDLYFPVSQILEDDLRSLLVDLVPSSARFISQFDRFEFFASFDHFLFSGRALGASFLWRRQKQSRDGGDLVSEIRNEAKSMGAKWKPLVSGILEDTKWSDPIKALDAFGDSVVDVMHSYRVW